MSWPWTALVVSTSGVSALTVTVSVMPARSSSMRIVAVLPERTRITSFRAAVNDKNQQFIYSWKALNQVHIVGERRNSPSGRELPAVVIEFKELTDKKDAALSQGIELKTREWRLIPDTN